MSDASPAILALSRRIVDRELQGCASDECCSPQLESLFFKLHNVTSIMVGEVGYQALLARAVRLVRRTHGWLPVLNTASVTVVPSFPRAEWKSYVEQVGIEEAVACAALLFATVLELLASFIGEDFTFRLIRRAWPVDDAAAGRSRPGEA